MKPGADDEFISSIGKACVTAAGWEVPEEDIIRTLIFMSTWVVVENKTSDADSELEAINQITDELIAALHHQVLTHFGGDIG